MFDYISLIVEEDHYFASKQLLPPFWGIIIARKVRDVVTFDYVRRPSFNSETSAESISQLLWKDEVYQILREKEFKGMSKLSRKKLWKVLVNNFSKEQIKVMVWETLQKRTEWKKSF